MANRLSESKSPYLLQHAENPVDWYPWGAEAFEKAEAEDKPVFLSIGYSACHWCHAMARESFSDPKTAEFLNRHFDNARIPFITDAGTACTATEEKSLCRFVIFCQKGGPFGRCCYYTVFTVNTADNGRQTADRQRICTVPCGAKATRCANAATCL